MESVRKKIVKWLFPQLEEEEVKRIIRKRTKVSTWNSNDLQLEREFLDNNRGKKLEEIK